MMSKVVWILLLSMTILFSKATIWKGTIANSEIYMFLPCDPNARADDKRECDYGVYFYKSTLQDIKMEEALSSKNKQHYKLQVKHSLEDNAKPIEVFELQHTNGKLLGHWKSKGKMLKVKLHPYKHSKKCKYSDDCFSKIREDFLKFKRGKVQKVTHLKKELVWLEEEHSKVSMFRLGNGFSSKIREKLNPLFDKTHTLDSIDSLTCGSRWSYGSGMESLANGFTYLSKNLLEHQTSRSYFCGGAYPDFYTSHSLYDLHTGKLYKLEDIVVFTKNTAEKLRELAFKAEGMKLEEQKKLDEENYDPYDLNHWEFMDWSYEKKGIRFFLNFSTPARCFRGDSYLIPFELLEPYKNKSFVYEFGE